MHRGQWVREFVKLPPTPKNLQAWEARRQVIVQEIAEDRFDYLRWFPRSRRARKYGHSRERVEQLLNRWLVAMESVLEQTSLAKCRQVVDNVLIPAFGRVPLAELGPGHVQDWIDAHGLARKTTSNYLWPLRQALARAVHVERSLREDPLVHYKVRRRRIDKHRLAEKGRSADPFLDDELTAAMLAAQPDLAPFVAFNVWTGLRLEEMFELHWGDVDRVRNRLWVHRARVGRVSKGTKTPSSNRYVTLLPPALAALDAAKALSYLQGGHVWVCLRTAGPWSEEALREAWRRACLRAGVRYRPPKHFRHTYAHRMLTAGEDLAAIAREMGHKDVGVTARVYAGYLDEIEGRRFGLKAARHYGPDRKVSA